MVTSLATWPGTVDGCDVQNKVTKGSCTGQQVGSGNNVAAQAAVNMNRWRGAYFCVLQTLGSRFQEKDADKCDDKTGADGVTNSNLGSKYTLDCGDHCFIVPKGYTQ